jgi:ubiquinone/menaquinone biosynthesis C-methylase UbiE
MIESAEASPIRSSIACCGSIRGQASASWTLPRASRAVAKRGARVIGADIAADLVAAAQERAKAEGLDIDYCVGDAEKLPFADGEFDAVISTCGVMFASPPRQLQPSSRA